MPDLVQRREHHLVVAKAGKVTTTAPNDGQVVYELAVLKTDEDPANRLIP